MQLNQLQQGLQQASFGDGHRLVFWYDDPGHFVDTLDELSLDGVQIILKTISSIILRQLRRVWS